MERMQGTDGVRRDVRLQSDPSLYGLTPWEAFWREGVITERLMEGYAYAFVREWFGDANGVRVAIGWDPRDPSGDFTSAVVAGVRRAGATAAILGVVPTPAVPMYVAAGGAAAGLMVTASHNPPAQNGIKIFLGPAGAKLMPADDVRLTRAVKAVNWDGGGLGYGAGPAEDARAEGERIFKGFHLAEENSWLEMAERPLSRFVLVVDPARGACSRVAAEVLEAYGAHVVEVNADAGDGRVNDRSGVAALEGIAALIKGDVQGAGLFSDFPALREIFELGAANARLLAGGDLILGACIFDADGDRFFLALFDPGGEGEVGLLSGDEVAVLQAMELTRRRPRGGRWLFVNTVESDLGVRGAVRSLGYEPLLKPVGDKWILREAHRLTLGEVGREGPFFGVGCEETGHAITIGTLRKAEGTEVAFAAGNGLKSALNTLAAVRRFKDELGTRACLRYVRSPFERGYKGNNYVLYSLKSELERGGIAYEVMNREIPAALAARAPGLTIKKVEFDEEPDLIYWAAFAFEGKEPVLAVFCRNSGTEDKSALYVRSDRARAAAAAALEEDLYPAFYALMKNPGDPRSVDAFNLLRYGVMAEDAAARQVLEKVERLGTPAGLTPRGAAVREAVGRYGKL